FGRCPQARTAKATSKRTREGIIGCRPNASAAHPSLERSRLAGLAIRSFARRASEGRSALAVFDTRQPHVVELRCYGGFSERSWRTYGPDDRADVTVEVATRRQSSCR